MVTGMLDVARFAAANPVRLEQGKRPAIFNEHKSSLFFSGKPKSINELSIHHLSIN